jgi:hypothetical protein
VRIVRRCTRYWEGLEERDYVRIVRVVRFMRIAKCGEGCCEVLGGILCKL